MEGHKIRAILGSLVIILLLVSYTGIVVLKNVTAHPPADMELAYDFENQILSVTITHITPAPTVHYVYKVDIEKNNEVYQSENYDSQPTTSIFTYTYPVPTSIGNTLKATAYCNIAGSISRTLTVTGENAPPSRPTLQGTTSGKTGTEYIYTAMSTDPENDKIFYCFDWGDGSDEFCTNLFDSGETVTSSHTWENDGDYIITVKATDENGAESEPATLGISMPNMKNGQMQSRLVFAEMGSTTWCPNCPRADEKISDLFSTGTPPSFYYVTLVYDQNTIAAKRGRQLSDAYIPMLYLDGGYQVVDETLKYASAIEALSTRDVHPLQMDISSEWRGDATCDVTVSITNEDSTAYLGHLRVYVTEITSRWNNQKGDPFHYALLDYAFDKYVYIPPGDTYLETTTWRGSDDHGGENYDDITQDNIMLIGAVSHWLPHLQSNPWTTPRPIRFFAQYVDQTTAAIPKPILK